MDNNYNHLYSYEQLENSLKDYLETELIRIKNERFQYVEEAYNNGESSLYVSRKLQEFDFKIDWLREQLKGF